MKHRHQEQTENVDYGDVVTARLTTDEKRTLPLFSNETTRTPLRIQASRACVVTRAPPKSVDPVYRLQGNSPFSLWGGYQQATTTVSYLGPVFGNIHAPQDTHSKTVCLT